jgi:DNA-binding NtrC family response regulator
MHGSLTKPARLCPPSNDQEKVAEWMQEHLLQHVPSLLPLAKPLALAACHDVTVLITGETGSGKTHLARLIHDCSARRGRPFVSVPCGSIAANLQESAFFGHVHGAFTDAHRNQEGKFAAAKEGTILLDEIDTLGVEQQAGLLRVLETGEYEPVGSNQTRRCLARVMVASNLDLERAVEEGRFRKDLYFRLDVFSFHLPSLRERRQDIGPLAHLFLGDLAAQFGKPVTAISDEALQLLEEFPWPGNLRQLQNAVQIAILCSDGEALRPEHLPPHIRSSSEGAEGQRRPGLLRSQSQTTERSMIQQVLAQFGENRSRAAQALGISRMTLYNKMKTYGLLGR